jgi:hypothetical protein
VSSTTSTIRLRIEATVEGFRDAVRGAELQLRTMAATVKDNQKAFDRFGTAIGKTLKGLAAVGVIANTVGTVVALTSSLSNLVPIIALAPAAVFTLVAAFATFKLATAGFSDALKGDAEAMAKLAPSARETALAIQGLRPQFDALRKSVQQEFFKNFASDVKLLGATYLPILQAKLPRIAAAFNDMGRSITRALTTGSSANDINVALGNTAKFLENARNAAGHFVAGLTPLIAFGSTYIPNIGTAIDGAADRFRAWSLRVTADGSLKEWVDGAIREFGFLKDLIGNVGEIFSAVFRGLSTGAGQDFLQTLAQTTQALADLLGQAEQQQALQALGLAFATIGEVTRDVFLEALRQLSPIIVELAPVFAEIARVVGDTLVNALQIVGPLLLDVAKFLNDNKEIIADLAPIVLGLWVAFKGASVLTGVIGSLRGLTTALGGPVALLKGGGLIALGALAVKIDEINVATAKSDGRPLNDMEDTLNDLVGAGRELITLDFKGIFADIGDELEQVRVGFETGSSPIGGFVQRLKDAVVQTGESFKEIGQFLADFGAKTGESFATIGTAIHDKAVEIAENVKTFFTDTVPTVVGNFFTSVGEGISTGASNIGTTVSDTFTTIGTTVQEKVKEIVQSITDFLSQTPHDIGFAIGATIGDLLAKIDEFGGMLKEKIVTFMIDFGTAISDGVTNAVTAFTEFPGRVGEAIAFLTQTLSDKAQEAGQAFLDWIGSFFTQTTDRAQQVPTDVGNAVSGAVDTLRQKAIDAGTAFLTAITNKFNETIAFLNTAPGRAGAAIADLVGVLHDKAVQAGQSFIDGVTAKFNEAITFIQSIPNRARAAIGDLGTLLTNAGKQLIDGLLSGIKAGYNNLIDFVSGIADGIAAHKGPLPHDRTVLRPAGLALMEGLLGGLRAGNEDVQAFVAGIAAQLADSASGSVSIAGARAATAAIVGAPANPAVAALERLTSVVAASGGPAVRVFIGDRELTDIVRTEVDTKDGDTAARVRAGGGATF